MYFDAALSGFEATQIRRDGSCRDSKPWCHRFHFRSWTTRSGSWTTPLGIELTLTVRFQSFFYFPRFLSSQQQSMSVHWQKKMGIESQIPRSLIRRIYAPLDNEFHFAVPISSSRTNECELVCLSHSLILDLTLEFNFHFLLINVAIQLCVSASNFLIDERWKVFYECCKGFLVPYSLGSKCKQLPCKEQSVC